jgi:hypothetical protein
LSSQPGLRRADPHLPPLRRRQRRRPS